MGSTHGVRETPSSTLMASYYGANCDYFKGEGGEEEGVGSQNTEEQKDRSCRGILMTPHTPPKMTQEMTQALYNSYIFRNCWQLGISADERVYTGIGKCYKTGYCFSCFSSPLARVKKYHRN